MKIRFIVEAIVAWFNQHECKTIRTLGKLVYRDIDLRIVLLCFGILFLAIILIMTVCFTHPHMY